MGSYQCNFAVALLSGLNVYFTVFCHAVARQINDDDDDVSLTESVEFYQIHRAFVMILSRYGALEIVVALTTNRCSIPCRSFINHALKNNRDKVSTHNNFSTKPQGPVADPELAKGQCCPKLVTI